MLQDQETLEIKQNAHEAEYVIHNLTQQTYVILCGNAENVIGT